MPYRLRELLGAVQSDVGLLLVVEGEKDVDRLRALGYPATCNPGGARKWRHEFAEYFRGALVVFVLADNDPEGRQHAQQVCTSLLRTVRTVKRHEFTDLPKGGDVSDWLDAGHTPEDLDHLLRQAAPFTIADLAPPEDPAASHEAPAHSHVGTVSAVVEDNSRQNPLRLLSLSTLPLSDQYNAEALVYLHGQNLRYCHPWKRWLLWDERRWKGDDTAAVMRLAKTTIKQMARVIESLEDDDDIKRWLGHIRGSLSAARLQAMVELAASEPEIPILPEALDTDPWQLNVQNGVIDLRTGQLRPHRRDDSISKLAPVAYDPNATCPRWERFLQEIFTDNEELITFIRRAVGYSLTGDVRERALFICYGVGRNGKSTFLETIAELLGEDYAIRTPTRTFLTKRDDGIPNDVAQLKGKRFVHASESGEGKRLDEEFIKDATGRDTLSARFMRGEWFQFKPQFKLWLRTNHKPVIRGTDPAIWDRPRLIPFTERFEGREEKDLPEKLRAELPGILTWAVQGCLSWQINGLGMPEAVQQANEAYRRDMDVLGDFLAECCIVAGYARVETTALYKAYVHWAEKNSEHPLGRRTFRERLQERGFMSIEAGHNKRYTWQGLALQENSHGIDG